LAAWVKIGVSTDSGTIVTTWMSGSEASSAAMHSDSARTAFLLTT
jgi:hypothetical protein